MRSRSSLRGVMLLELIAAIVIIALVLVPTSDAITRAGVKFSQSRFSLEGRWMAHVMMNALVSQELPAYDDENHAVLTGNGSLADFLREVMQVDEDDYSEQQWENFEAWTYEYEKKFLLLSKDAEQGYTEPDENGELPLYVDENSFNDVHDDDYDPYEEEPTEEEFLETLHAQFVRIRLTLNAPIQTNPDRDEGEYSEEEQESGITEATDPDRFVIVTFVDFDDFKEDVDDADPYTPGSGGAPDGGGGGGNPDGGGP